MMEKLNPQKAAGLLVSLTGLYFLIRFVPSLLFVLNKPMADKTAEYSVVIVLAVFVISGIYLIFTRKAISAAKAKFLFGNAVIVIICSLIPEKNAEFISASTGFTFLALVVYFISFPIIILTSKRNTQ